MRKKSDNGLAGHDRDLEIPRITRSEMRRGVMGKYAGGSFHRFVELDPDVARVFKTSDSVNSVLRGIIGGLANVKPRKKSA